MTGARKFALVLLAWLLLTAAPLQAQISLSYTFVAGTVISPDEVNNNFTTLANAALNRTGGTITGNITVSAGVTIDGVDVGTLGTSGTPTYAGLIITGTGASAIDVTGGINAGTGNVGIIGTDGRMPALTSTYVASLAYDAANLTGTVADARLSANIARLATAQSWTANQTFSGTAPQIGWSESDQASGSRGTRAVVDGQSWILEATNDAVDTATLSLLSVTRAGAVTVPGTLAVTGTSAFTGQAAFADFRLNSATSLTATAGAASVIQPAGFVVVNIGGTAYKLAYFGM